MISLLRAAKGVRHAVEEVLRAKDHADRRRAVKPVLNGGVVNGAGYSLETKLPASRLRSNLVRFCLPSRLVSSLLWTPTRTARWPPPALGAKEPASKISPNPPGGFACPGTCGWSAAPGWLLARSLGYLLPALRVRGIHVAVIPCRHGGTPSQNRSSSHLEHFSNFSYTRYWSSFGPVNRSYRSSVRALPTLLSMRRQAYTAPSERMVRWQLPQLQPS